MVKKLYKEVYMGKTHILLPCYNTKKVKQSIQFIFDDFSVNFSPQKTKNRACIGKMQA